MTGCHEPKVSVGALDQLITRELPVGSNKSQVLAFLDSRNLEHSDDGGEGKVYANIRYAASWPPFTEKTIHMEFQFDASGRLVSHRIGKLSLQAPD